MVIRKYDDSDFDGVFKILKESFPEVGLEDYPLEVSSLQLDNSHVQYVPKVPVNQRTDIDPFSGW